MSSLHMMCFVGLSSSDNCYRSPNAVDLVLMSMQKIGCRSVVKLNRGMKQQIEYQKLSKASFCVEVWHLLKLAWVLPCPNFIAEPPVIWRTPTPKTAQQSDVSGVAASYAGTMQSGDQH